MFPYSMLSCFRFIYNLLWFFFPHTIWFFWYLGTSKVNLIKLLYAHLVRELKLSADLLLIKEDQKYWLINSTFQLTFVWWAKQLLSHSQLEWRLSWLSQLFLYILDPSYHLGFVDLSEICHKSSDDILCDLKTNSKQIDVLFVSW